MTKVNRPQNYYKQAFDRNRNRNSRGRKMLIENLFEDAHACIIVVLRQIDTQF